MRTFLIGGGAGSQAAHRPFAEAIEGSGPVVVYLLDEPDAEPDRWVGELRNAGLESVQVITVSNDRPPLAGDLDGAAGLYVAGGLTPGYRDVLVGGGTEWFSGARELGLPYAGFSAGSAIAPTLALVGGWQATHGGRVVQAAHEDVGEDLDQITVAPGLGLVSFLVDVHAAQWGTLHRLLYAVLDPDGPGEGWAIDEATALEVVDGTPVAVHGTGAATRVRRSGDSAVVAVFLAEDDPGGS